MSENSDPNPAGSSFRVYRLKVGDFTVTAINDGHTSASFDLVTGIDKDRAAKLHAAAHRPSPPTISLTTFLIDDGSKLTLIDTVLLTHLHVDHVGGLIDSSGQKVFPRAKIMANEKDVQFWRSEPPAGAPAPLLDLFKHAKIAISVYHDQLATFREGAIDDGIAAVEIAGHTPGHSGFEVASRGERLWLWGDVVHLPGIQFAEPRAGVAFDIDPDQAIKSRRRAFERAAKEELKIAGAHLDFPCFGYVDRAADGYAFIPDLWHVEP